MAKIPLTTRFFLLAMGLSSGCGDEREETSACSRYGELTEIMSYYDVEYWSPAMDCPSDGDVAAQGWEQRTLADCVAYIEGLCASEDDPGCSTTTPRACRCSVALGAERSICTPGALTSP